MLEIECTRSRQEYRVVIYCRNRRPTRQRLAAHDTASFSPLIFARFDSRPPESPTELSVFFQSTIRVRQLYGKFEIYLFFKTPITLRTVPRARARDDYLFNTIRRTT